VNASAPPLADPVTRAPADAAPVRATALLAVLARLGEVAGKKRMMLASLTTFAFGTLVCAVAGNLAELIVGRVIQGAAGGIYPLAFAIIRDRLPRERVPGGIGLVSSLLGIGGGLGLVLPGRS
jgi:MFS family permease